MYRGIRMKNLIIVVEGPDNVGKSTLINNLRNTFNNIAFQIVHYSSAPVSGVNNTIDYNTRMYRSMFDMMKAVSKEEYTGIICDRSHLGEMVYGPIYRGYSGEYVLDIEKKYMDIPSIWDNLFLITLYDEPENVISRDDGLSFSTDIRIKREEIKNFINAHDKSNIKNKLLLNIKNHDADAVLNEVLTFINIGYEVEDAA